jgi:hypothetical protein
MRNRPAVDASSEARVAIDAVLDRFGKGALRLAATSGVRFVHLRRSERYRDRSRTLRRIASAVDDWPVPPAGLFVVEERAVYLRSTSPMTVAHEFAHARVIFSSTLSQTLGRPLPRTPGTSKTDDWTRALSARAIREPPKRKGAANLD